MRRFFILLNREVGHYFHQPLAYVVLFFFLLLTGLNFYTAVMALNHDTNRVSLVEFFFNSLFLWFPLVLSFPLLTMRLFSEEYKSGTIETLMTAPVSDVSVVLSKFFSAFIFYVILWLPSILYFVIFSWTTGQRSADSLSAYVGAYSILFLVGLFYLSIGCLASALTNQQIIAAVTSFAVICVLFFIHLLSFFFPTTSPFLRDLAYYFSTVEHMSDFTHGVFDTRPVVFYLSLTVFTLFLTFHVFQYRRWRA
jgi:ABC-2 type transport system permease protein